MNRILLSALVLLNLCFVNQAMAMCTPSGNCRTCSSIAERTSCEKAQAEIEYLNAKKKALENCHCNCQEHHRH